MTKTTKTTRTVIIDYGSGNLRSVSKAFEHISDGIVQITSDPKDLQSATHIVLPGVGAFGDCAAGLRALNGMVAELEKQVLDNKKPFLGICVGMQLLAAKGYEYGEHDGLGWIGGEVRKIKPSDKGLPIPHMGWNSLNLTKSQPLNDKISGDVYFVHSYQLHCDEKYVLATCDYGSAITAIVAKGNIMGVQFHPEKSQQIGLSLLKNFLEI
ncbi:MAG: imidazole glycerol phosphate synthase subunit HisH [Alphaproteobacteria bacterium CG11_big_fil_rev_8_21_14_0_20_44_7]|nr:MAG: imidazole glycerol phosphate synthase subunit HisH [Alphaproteobacteria bacterium CG11_big_fil_rev_8_21_14_0_20_44_7]